MAALSTEVKAFIVQSLACYETPVKVIELVKAEYGIDVSRQQVSQYTPGNAMAAKLSQKWIDLFNATRKRFQNEIADIPIANNKATADFMISSPLMNETYDHRVINFHEAIADRAKTL